MGEGEREGGSEGDRGRGRDEGEKGREGERREAETGAAGDATHGGACGALVQAAHA